MSEKPPLTRVVMAGNTAYVSGQLPRGADGAIIAAPPLDQVRQALSNLQAALASVGYGLGDVVKVTAWLTDAAYMADFNAAYREFFAEPYPARSVVVSQLIAQGAVVEVEATAYRA